MTNSYAGWSKKQAQDFEAKLQYISRGLAFRFFIQVYLYYIFILFRTITKWYLIAHFLKTGVLLSTTFL